MRRRLRRLHPNPLSLGETDRHDGEHDGEAALVEEARLWPHPVILLVGAAVIAAVSFSTLAWPDAAASTVLGTLMIAGAEVDARTFLLPDTVTLGALASGLVAAFALEADDRWLAGSEALLRALATAAILLGVRWGYARLRGREGLGLGDIKLAGAIGAWLPVAAIPVCFGLAATSALVLVLVAQLGGRPIELTTRLPFGAFLCPALWLVYYVGALAG
jgi:leader peptidase (prepilin peptidase)/N-methyltransferase